MHRQGAETRTCFQEAGPPQAAIDLKADVAIAYGLDDTLAGRCAGWRDRGYVVHVMTGVAWSEDQRDYVEGRWDGAEHTDERQTGRDGNPRMHHAGVAYMVPTERYARFRAEKLRLAVDAGAEAIHLEEPEFWVATGYSPAFRRLWEEHYGEPWEDPESNAHTQWRASELKAQAYLDSLAVLCRELKRYALEQYGRDLRFYVPTHSLVNYSQWGIVSPESRLLEIPGCDGYIAQVWTGTARTPNRYRGVRRERTFETAFLEYGAMADLVRGTPHRLWLLHDPVEDDPRHTWMDYRANWQRTVVASLFQTHIADFEVAPWPSRVFQGRYPATTEADRERLPLSEAYASELLGVMNALADMAQPAQVIHSPVAWGTVGLAISDSMMNQRGRPGPADLEYDQFYGQALPLMKAGAPVRPVQLECLPRPGHLDGLRLLVLSYDLQKPPSADTHARLTAWVRGGGALLYLGAGANAFTDLPGWWNREGYGCPEDHLWSLLYTGQPGPTPVRCGLGWVAHVQARPESLAQSAAGCDLLVATVGGLVKSAGLAWEPGTAWSVRRGPYVVAAVLDEGPGAAPLTLSGWLVNLFDAALRPLCNPTLAPGQVGLWVQVPPPGASPCLLAAQGRTEPPTWDGRTFAFRVGGPEGTVCGVRIFLPRPATAVRIRTHQGSEETISYDWHAPSSTAAIRFPNRPDWVEVRVYVPEADERP